MIMPVTVLVRMHVDLDLDKPQEAVARTLADIIEHGISALRHQLPPWRVELDAESGIITLRR